MKGVFLDSKSFDELSLKALETTFTQLDVYSLTAPLQVAERIQDADVIITNKVVLDAAALAQTRAKLICIVATGTNNVDLAAATKQGITVTNCQAYGVNSVVQHTISLMLALHTRILDYDRSSKAGQWAKSDQFCLLDFPINEVFGKTLGIIGYGHLGQGVANIAKAFNMKVLVAQRDDNDNRVDRVPLDTLLRESDVVSLHCPLTEQTRNLIDHSAFKKMKSSAFIINVARGGVVNESDLADALRSGLIAGAATDVLTEEPPIHSNPLLDDSLPNLIVTPHSAWGSVQSRETILSQTVENITAYLDGSPVRTVN